MEKVHSASKAYAWMGLSLPDAEEEDQPKVSKSHNQRSQKVQYPDEDAELGEWERLETATHWRIERQEEGDFLIHRWETGIKLKALPVCAECRYGRFLWCKKCGPSAMSGANTSMQIIMAQIARKNQKRFDLAQEQARVTLGSGLYWTDLDLRKTSFLGIEAAA